MVPRSCFRCKDRLGLPPLSISSLATVFDVCRLVLSLSRDTFGDRTLASLLLMLRVLQLLLPDDIVYARQL